MRIASGRFGLATYRRPGTLIWLDSSMPCRCLVPFLNTLRTCVTSSMFPFDPVAGQHHHGRAEGRVTIDMGSVETSYEVTIAIPQPSDPNTHLQIFGWRLGDAFILGLLNITGRARMRGDLTISTGVDLVSRNRYTPVHQRPRLWRWAANIS